MNTKSDQDKLNNKGYQPNKNIKVPIGDGYKPYAGHQPERSVVENKKPPKKR